MRDRTTSVCLGSLAACSRASHIQFFLLINIQRLPYEKMEWWRGPKEWRATAVTTMETTTTTVVRPKWGGVQRECRSYWPNFSVVHRCVCCRYDTTEPSLLFYTADETRLWSQLKTEYVRRTAKTTTQRWAQRRRDGTVHYVSRDQYGN